MSATVMITTGGTGGHVFPGLAVAARLVAKGCEVFWLGTRDGIEARLVPQHGVDFEAIRFGGVRGKGLRQLLLGPFSLLLAFWQSLRVIRRRAPDVVLGFGGFASFPGALMGVARGRPLAIHDANAVAGLANRILAYGATAFCSAFPMPCAASTRPESSGSAIRCATRSSPSLARKSASTGDGTAQAARPRRQPRRGRVKRARPRGTCAAGTVAASASDASGRRSARRALRQAYATAGAAAECVPFIEDMARRYAEADLVICRGGALTVAEIAAVGVASLIVPLPGAIANEQTHNARFLVDAGAASLVPQTELTPQLIADMLAGYDREGLLAMAIAARSVARTDATERVAAACIDLARSR
jgi:UDP-N-acetylglucosamine--N-acetylmuramyl-(pentapeptide) pyrophosphoryl-undecaprenol N-acetylglucosamine transferase